MRRRVSRGLRVVGAALSTALATGCTGGVDGGAVRQQPVNLQQVLPSPDQVFSAVGSPLEPVGSPRIGGVDLLPNGIKDGNDATPIECLGSATPLMRSVYQPAGVREVALQDYARYGQGFTVSSVHAGVVRLNSDAQAAKLFDAFAARWNSCAGTRVNVHVTPTSSLEWTVTDVRRADRVVSATILNGEGGQGTAFPTERAIGLAADCIIDVDVAVIDTVPERRVATGRAIALVRMMQDEIARAR